MCEGRVIDMDFIFFEQPIYLFIPLILVGVLLLSKLLKNPMYMTVVSAVLHAAAIALLLVEGTLEDALATVLLSALVALFLSPKPLHKGGENS